VTRVIEPWLALGVGAAGALGAAAFGLYGSRQVVRVGRSEFRDDPAAWKLPAERVAFPSRDGVELAAWLVPSPTARATVVLVHGYTANRDFTFPVAAMLHPRFHVLAPDLRAHGESGGKVTTLGYLERQDVLATVDQVTRRLSGPIGVLGVSMGAVAAVLAAAEDRRIAAVVADSPFDSLRGVLAHAARARGYPSRLTPLLAEITCRTIALQQRYPVRAGDAIRAIPRISPRPVLIVHSAADEICTVDHAHRLYAAARQPKELWIVPDVTHALLYQTLADEYRTRMLAFFERWLDPAPTLETAS
jgi:dipeptidyl aminopeptidase/acylaminoacyl peptidase